MAKDTEFKEGQWKMILTKSKKKSKDAKSQEERIITTYKIITNDPRQLILCDWVEDENGSLEIGKQKFKPSGRPTFHPDYLCVINSFLKNKHNNPNFDIEAPNDVIKLYEELISEARRLYNIDNMKNIV